MGSEIRRSASGRSQRWLRKKSKKSEPSSSAEVSDSEPEEYLSHSFISSRETQTSGLTHELSRVFVGTWNVGGKSPVGSLAADLNEWLNLKNSVDIYVLGFQEIVPLNTMSVIGMEDYTDARKWNLLIGKTLNNKDGNVWLTPTTTPTINDDYQYAKPSKSGEKAGFKRSTTPMRERWKTKHGGEECGNPTYKLMASKKMVGIFASVWMKREILRKYRVSNVKACTIACGLMGCLGNKGAVSVSMSIEGTSFCFVTAHLASGQKKGDEMRRNQQVGEIFKRTAFPRLPQEFDDPLPPIISGHEYIIYEMMIQNLRVNDSNSRFYKSSKGVCSSSNIDQTNLIFAHCLPELSRIFWFGDLNYRLYMDDDTARELIRKKKWKELQKFDQLKKEQQRGVFQGWKEGDVEFAPTYKYSVELGNRYTGDKHAPFNPNTGEKRRTPAWCDRIMWFGKGIQQLSYFRGESRFSDHRPVSALFTAEIDVLGPPNSKTVSLSKFLNSMNLSRFVVNNGPTTTNTTTTTKRTLLSLIKAEAEESENEDELIVDNTHNRS